MHRCGVALVGYFTSRLLIPYITLTAYINQYLSVEKGEESDEVNLPKDDGSFRQ